MPDVIDLLVGIAAGTPLDAIRARRPQARAQAQASYVALLNPPEPGDVNLPERFALAAFVAGLHGEAAAVAFYRAGLSSAGGPDVVQDAITAALAEAAAQGPYGHFPPGPLSGEDSAGPTYAMGDAARAALGPRLTAAFEHAHMLVFHPRDAAPAHLQALYDAGWSTTAIVTLSQIVAFLSFQLRVVHGLRIMAA